MGKPFFVYILLCADGSYYVGHTDDLENRVWEHEQGGKCRYTTWRRPIKLVCFQEFPTREEAKEAEAKIKNWSRKKKEALVSEDYSGLQELARKKEWEEHRKRVRLRD